RTGCPMRVATLTSTVLAPVEPGRAGPDGVADGPVPASGACPGSITLPIRNAATTTSSAAAAPRAARPVRRRHGAPASASPGTGQGADVPVRCLVGTSVTGSGATAGYRIVCPAAVTAASPGGTPAGPPALRRSASSRARPATAPALCGRAAGSLA